MNNAQSARDDYAAQRENMVRRHIMGRGIRDPQVCTAFRNVPRERFIPEQRRAQSYEDHPVSIGHGQTVSQPYIVALMLAELKLESGRRVLEIGTGSGYQTALLAEICGEVYTIERIPELARAAREQLDGMGYANVFYRVGDGTLGWHDEAPFDAIIVSAAAPRVPEPLKQQLAVGGRMVLPVGGSGMQDLLLLERNDDEIRECFICSCVFVKLIGKEGCPGNG